MIPGYMAGRPAECPVERATCAVAERGHVRVIQKLMRTKGVPLSGNPGEPGQRQGRSRAGAMHVVGGISWPG